MLKQIRHIEEIDGLSGEICAGGTDLLERRRSRVASGPVVDIHKVAGLKEIYCAPNEVGRIGALTTITALTQNTALQQYYPGLVAAALEIATPQIRNVATVGGALLQRSRCWYFRHAAFVCFKNGGNICPARSGDHHYGVCFDLGPCVFPHPSTLGMVLMAYGAEVEINGTERISIDALYGDGSDPHLDHHFPEGKILTRIFLPPPLAQESAMYVRMTARERAEWPLIEVFVRLLIEEKEIQYAQIGVGGVANIPLLLPHAAESLIGKTVDLALLNEVSILATAGTNPLPMTEYKVSMLQRTVFEALQHLTADLLLNEDNQED